MNAGLNHEFQFHIGLIKSSLLPLGGRGEYLFQFHIGLIKS